MPKRKYLILLLHVGITMSVSSLVAAAYFQSQSGFPHAEQKSAQSKPAGHVETHRFPIVDFPTSKIAEPQERAKRLAKAKKYNSRHAPKLTESTDQITSFTDWELGLPALPVARSSAVIIGTIISADAHVSEDETAIYSEFAVRIEAVVKNDNQNLLRPNESIAVERTGGRVRFPSGKIVVSTTNNQDMPQIGKRYLLFLLHNFPMVGESQDFNILTGYELRGGHVFPLDKIPGHSMAAYDGVDEELFLKDLWSAVKASSPSLPRA